jgi:Na+-translocating ferredoxin:NAD+ oxidoreductase RnfG subunit
MKTISKFQVLLLVFSMATVIPSIANNGTKDKAPITNTAEEKAKVDVMVKRIKEIRDMDKSDLSKAERKALRKEVKEIRTALKDGNGGVYLSIGAIIIIILLLILIL